MEPQEEVITDDEADSMNPSPWKEEDLIRALAVLNDDLKPGYDITNRTVEVLRWAGIIEVYDNEPVLFEPTSAYSFLSDTDRKAEVAADLLRKVLRERYPKFYDG